VQISADKTKVLVFEGEDATRIKIIVNNKIIEHILHFIYLGYNTSPPAWLVEGLSTPQ
jgi:hypothetical protein